MQTMQQKRAAFALKKVQQALDNNVNQKEYKSYASSFPAMIHMNGLGQAAAFYYSQKGTHFELYKVLSEWLVQSDQPFYNYRNSLDDRALLEGITDSNMDTYRLAQAEAQALMDWVKKFAKAFMGGDE